MKHALYLLFALCLLCTSQLHAQKDTVRYRDRAAAVQQEVWAWNVPAFKNYKTPAAYTNESYVILARRATIEASSKRKMDWAFGAPTRYYYYNSTVREMVKINDKAALEQYSQLTYQQFKKLNRWMSATTTTFVGIHIVKPDGTIKNVGIDESILLKTGDNGWERKLAVSDLQVGDILDYYIRVEEYSESQREPEKLIFVFGDEHPILDYSIHCNIGDKYAVEYRSMNKAPDATQTTNADHDLILDLDMKDLPADPSDLWMSDLRQVPAFRINVLAGKKETTGRSMGEVIKNVPLWDVLRRADIPENPIFRLQFKNIIHKVLRDQDPHFNKLPKDSIAALVYYVYRFHLYYDGADDDALEVGELRNHMKMNSGPYLSLLSEVLYDFQIHSTLLAVPSRYGPNITEVMNPGDLSYILRVDVDNPFYISCENMFTPVRLVPAYKEGQPVIELSRKNFSSHSQIDLNTLLPVSAASDNQHVEKMQVDFADADMQLLHCKRQTALSGQMKEDEQLHLLNFEDCYEIERQACGVEKSVMDQLKKQRKKKNISEDYETALQKARASLKDRFNDEVAGEFGVTPKALLSYKVDNPGIRHNTPYFIYSTEFTLDGLVQRAGNNFLLNIGKTFSSPLSVPLSERDRKVDIYMPYARTLEQINKFTIPQGYTVQGVEKLNVKFENDCGSFMIDAWVQGNQLIVHLKRVYKHNYEPVTQWPKLLAILDAASTFSTQKVLLKRG